MTEKQIIAVERSFEHPIEVVFARYADHEGWSRWAGFGRVYRARDGAPEPNGVGSERAFRVMPGLREEITRYEPPAAGRARVDYRVSAGPMPFTEHRGEVLFESEGRGTRIRWSVSLRPRLPGTGGALRAGLALLFRQVLARLARDLATGDNP